MPRKQPVPPDENRSLIAFVDLLGTSYYARTDGNLYHEHLNKFRTALEEYAPSLDGTGNVYFFSDCAYMASSDAQKLIKYVTEVRSYLLPHHVYLQGAIQAGRLEPKSINNSVVLQGTIFGPDVARVYAIQDALKGAAVRVETSGFSGVQEISKHCVVSCHLPSHSSSTPECFLDIKYETSEIDRLTVENLLVDCMRARAVGRNGGAYYIAPLITMINSVSWSINVEADAVEDEKGARNLFNLIIRDDFVRHLGDLRGAHLVLYSMLNQAYLHSEGLSVCKEIQRYIASKPSILARIDSIPQAILSFEHRRRFLESAVVWSKKPRKKIAETHKENRALVNQKPEKKLRG
jgi:hypothetical protein